ncbi:MAG: GGDEF domain-containing protein [Eubacteriales bacterium]|nr:GGDEF domain-containing protein [Eubacteriales bacterium]
MKANAETDSLTGLLNRTTFTKKMEKVLAQRKQELFTALLMLDIDDFKQLNDCYGHIAGDHALIEVAKTLKSMLRPNDLVGRLGGDEFLVCLCDLPDDGVIERRVDWFREQMKESLQTVTPLTASVGISVSPKDGNDFNTLYQKADVALYHAKRSGKNHHSFYQESMESLNT